MVEVAETAAVAAREAERLASEGRFAEAIVAYQSLLQRAPEYPDCWYNLGRLQRRLGQFEEALASYAQALRRGVREPEEVHLNRAVIFADGLHSDAEAEHELAAALAINPGYLPALQNLANLYEDLGRGNEAQALYERILERWPQAFESLARYGILRGALDDADDALIARLRTAVAYPTATAAERASLGFALAQLLDRKGEYSAAFAAAAAANRVSRIAAGASATYDRVAHERFIDAIIAAFPHRVTAPLLELPRDAAALEPRLGWPRPIFVCGMFRSGSTLAERLLTAHPQVASGGELDLLPRLVQANLIPFPARVAQAPNSLLERIATEYLDQLARLFPGAAWVTDKRPDNFLLIGLIKRLFPQARIVHTTRDALDTCLSIFFLHLDPGISWSLDLMDIGHYYRQYRRLMAHWRLIYDEDILDFDYDALVRDPRPVAQRLVGFCGLDWHESCLQLATRGGRIRSASVWQVREELYRRSSGRARNYARDLAPLAAYLDAR